MLTKVIPSYLYVQYNDDVNLQAFVDAFNNLSQQYVTFFSGTGLPVYTGLTGGLLDWVGVGLYGVVRPTAPTTGGRLVGPYNTWAFNTIPFNGRGYVLGGGFAAASDDLYKRVITWNFLKGDGRQFDVRWLKRRIMRFLNGPNGVSYNVDQTYPVSVSLLAGRTVQVRINRVFDPTITAALAYLMKTATLQLPFQCTFNVTL